MKTIYYLFATSTECSIVSEQYINNNCPEEAKKSNFKGSHRECVLYAMKYNLNIIEDFL